MDEPEQPLYTLRTWADRVASTPADADYIIACIRRNSWEKHVGFEAEDAYWENAANGSGLHPMGRYFRLPLTKHIKP